MTRLGFVGLGTMGEPLVRRLLEAGYEVTGYNRTRARAAELIRAGMNWADSPGQVAAQSEITFTMVTDRDALAAVVDGERGILAHLEKGAILADVSTVGPPAVAELAFRVRARGAHLVDCPISGSPAAVMSGRASFMLGGDEAPVARVAEVLSRVGSSAVHVGPVGTGALMKLAANIQVAVPFLALAEGLALAEKGGIPREVALKVLLSSATMSPALAFRAPFTVTPPHPAPFDVHMMEKDVALILEAGRTIGVALPTTAVTAQMLTVADALGLGEEDFSAVFFALLRMSGLNPEPSNAGDDPK